MRTLSVDEHILRREHWVPQAIEDVFAFFSEARNLEAITPPWLGFRIISPGPIDLRPGARIHYRIRLHGLPLRWVTEIRTWEPPHEFVDVQLQGPYRLWHHTHRFEPVDGGTLVRDTVRYVLPFGPLGSCCSRVDRGVRPGSDLRLLWLRITEVLGPRSAHGETCSSGFNWTLRLGDDPARSGRPRSRRAGGPGFHLVARGRGPLATGFGLAVVAAPIPGPTGDVAPPAGLSPGHPPGPAACCASHATG